MRENRICQLKKLFEKYAVSIFGLCNSEEANEPTDLDGIMSIILELRQNSKEKKDWETADKIRDGLNNLNIEIKDTKDGASWSYKK